MIHAFQLVERPQQVTPELPSPPPLRFYQGISKSLHFVQRAQERGLKEEVLEFILSFGTEFHRAGALHLTVMEKRLPRALRNSSMAQKARDWVVLFADGDTMLTCYRRKNAAQFLKKKSQRRLSETQLENHPVQHCHVRKGKLA